MVQDEISTAGTVAGNTILSWLQKGMDAAREMRQNLQKVQSIPLNVKYFSYTLQYLVMNTTSWQKYQKFYHGLIVKLNSN